MSKEDIERLVTERSVVRQTFDEHQVAGFWAKAIASYEDARAGSRLRQRARRSPKPNVLA